MKQHIITALVAGLVVVGCGSDDGSGDSSSAQDRVADLIIGAAADAGASPDEQCIRDKAAEISDDDAQAMVDAGLDGDPDISGESGEILAEILLC